MIAPQMDASAHAGSLGEPVVTIRYWADAYADPASCFGGGHGMVVALLREYAALRESLEARAALGLADATALDETPLETGEGDALDDIGLPAVAVTASNSVAREVAPDDAFTASYIAACRGHAPDHNEIGLHYFRAGAAISQATAGARNDWKEAVLDALAQWPGMDYALDTSPRTIVEAILKMEREAATELMPHGEELPAPGQPPEIVITEHWQMDLLTLLKAHGASEGDDVDDCERKILAWCAALRKKRPWPKTATPEMIAAFKRRYKEGSFWSDRITGAIEAMLEAATTVDTLPARWTPSPGESVQSTIRQSLVRAIAVLRDTGYESDQVEAMRLDYAREVIVDRAALAALNAAQAVQATGDTV